MESRFDCSIGAHVVIKAAARLNPNVKATTGTFTDVSPNRGTSSGASTTIAASSQRAKSKPATPPTSETTTDSTIDERHNAAGVAPSASRTMRSRFR
jgi:hypothetical protein